MKDTFRWTYNRLHLIISVIIVVPTAIIYGFSPKTLLPQYLDISVTTIDLSNFLRAVMFFYLGASLIWIMGIINTKYWKPATHLNLLFMATLGIGRLISMLIDGLPSGGYIFGVIAELVLAAIAFYQLRRSSVKHPSY